MLEGSRSVKAAWWKPLITISHAMYRLLSNPHLVHLPSATLIPAKAGVLAI